MINPGGIGPLKAGIQAASPDYRDKDSLKKEPSGDSKTDDVFTPGTKKSEFAIIPDPIKNANSFFGKQVSNNYADSDKQTAGQSSPLPESGSEASTVESSAGKEQRAEPSSKDTIEKFDNLTPEGLRTDNVTIKNTDLRDKADLLKTSWFSSNTPWPSAEKMPPKDQFDPDKILKDTMDPGRGIKALHKQGIDGSGINVAVVDTPLNPNHEQIKNSIVAYHTEHAGKKTKLDIHGQGTSSLIVGKDTGTAPGAKLHHYAAPYEIQGPEPIEENFKDILKYNEGKDLKDKIRVVSLSAVWDTPELTKTVKALEDSGTMVITCADNISGAQVPLGKDKDDLNNYESPYYIKYYPEKDRPVKENPDGRVMLLGSIDNRTVASPEGENSYLFIAKAGTSWAAPDLAGIAALGFQVNQDMTPAQARQFMAETGKRVSKSGVLVDPKAFIARVQEEKEQQTDNWIIKY